jgi:hypothetical protein
MVSYAVILIYEPQAQRVQPKTFSWSTGGIQISSGPDIDGDRVVGSDTRYQSTKEHSEVATQMRSSLTSRTGVAFVQEQVRMARPG